MEGRELKVRRHRDGTYCFIYVPPRGEKNGQVKRVHFRLENDEVQLASLQTCGDQCRGALTSVTGSSDRGEKLLKYARTGVFRYDDAAPKHRDQKGMFGRMSATLLS